jgi:carbohydrate-binding DOMON domain-containing protein
MQYEPLAQVHLLPYVMVLQQALQAQVEQPTVWSPATALSTTTGASVTANPSSTITYTVNGTSAAGCSNTSTVTITVNAMPAIGAGSSVANM